MRLALPMSSSTSAANESICSIGRTGATSSSLIDSTSARRSRLGGKPVCSGVRPVSLARSRLSIRSTASVSLLAASIETPSLSLAKTPSA